MVGFFKEIWEALISPNKFFLNKDYHNDKRKFLKDYLKPFLIGYGLSFVIVLITALMNIFWFIYPLVASDILGAYSFNEIFDVIIFDIIGIAVLLILYPILFLLFSGLLYVVLFVFNIRKNVLSNTLKVFGYSSIIVFVYGIFIALLEGLYSHAVPKFDIFWLEKPALYLMIVLIIALVIHFIYFIIIGISSMNNISRLKASLMFFLSILSLIFFVVFIALCLFIPLFFMRRIFY